MTDYTRPKGAALPSQRFKQIVEGAISRHERMCAQFDGVKERINIKHSRQAADEAWQVLKRASNAFH